METHCCFNTDDKCISSLRIHVPLARTCDMGCIYCGYRKDKNITSSSFLRPGTAAKIVYKKDEIRNYLREAMTRFPDNKIVGVSGPGDPLQNIESLCDLAEIIKEENYKVKLCICSNGRLFFDNGIAIISYGLVDYFTFTINSLDPSAIPTIYDLYKNSSFIECDQLIRNQINAIQYCKSQNIKVKVNTVFLKDINDNKLGLLTMFKRLKSYGVDCFNLLPEVDNINGRIKNSQERDDMYNALKDAGFKLTRQCSLCRSDFCGY